MNRFLRNLVAVSLVVAAMLLLISGSARAQTFRGTILGTVTDSSGAAVPGADVTIKNVNTGLIRTLKTSESGDYTSPELPIGTYDVKVEKSGFKTSVVSNVSVEVSAERRVDVTLQPGALTQQVQVIGEEIPQVDATSDTLGGIIESKVATNLPVNGRDYQKLIYLVPGVTGSPDQITDSPGSFGIFSVNGARGRANNFLLDGTDMNDGYRNDPAINEAGVFGTPATILPVEAIAELHVASNFEAEYGRSAGGVVNIVTKSGTNAFHGSGFDYFRNTVLDARNFFNDVGVPKDPFHDNQFGGALGGPIIQNKAFFFVDYEGVRESGALALPSCVPTVADITNNTPATGINPVIANLIAAGKAWPAPTGPGSCLVQPTDAIQQTYEPTNTVFATPFVNNVNGGMIKIDYNFNKNNLLTGRYFIGDSTQNFPLALVGGGATPGYNTITPTRVQLVSISYVSVISPTTVNEARLGWIRFAEGFQPQDWGFNPASIGLNTGGTGVDSGMPVITVGGLPQIGASAYDLRHRVDSNWHFIDGISWTKGKNDIKFGYEYRRTTVSQIFDAFFRGKLEFDSLADFLAGLPDGGFQYSGDSNRNTLQNSNAAYVQDTYHWSSRITITAGLRYDYFGIIQDKQGDFTNVYPTTGVGFDVGPGRLYQPDFRNWAPRASVAWDVFGHQKTIVRAGFGIFYDAFSQDMFMGHIPFNSNYDPGPAYSAFGPNPISYATLAGGSLSTTAPVYSGPGAMPDAFGVDQNMRTPYMENYNLNIQQQITTKSTLQVGFVGSEGHRLLRFRDINQPTLAQIQQFDYAAASGFDPSNPQQTSGCYCTPRYFAATSPFYYINFEEASANSVYNSLQASWNINGWHGLTSTLNYVWSHSIDDASDGEDYVPNATQPDNSQGPSNYNRGNSNFDVRQRFTWNFIYQLPNAANSSWKLLRNGWGLNGIVTVQSGQPFHLNYDFEDDYNGTGEGFARPDVVGPIRYNQNDPNEFLDLSSFAVPCTLSGGTGAGNCQLINPTTGAICTASGIGPNCINSMHFGTLGRNALIGPHFRQFDFSVFKNTPITERLNLELRFEAYNILNHPNFANPYLPYFIADAAPNGIAPSGQSIGYYHLSATGDVGIGYPFLGSGGPRSIQLAAKFSF